MGASGISGLSVAEVLALISSGVTFQDDDGGAFVVGNEADTGATLNMPDNDGTTLIIAYALLNANGLNASFDLHVNDDGVNAKSVTQTTNAGGSDTESRTILIFYTAQNNGQVVKLRARCNNGGLSSTSSILAIHFNA